jgi:hypothetical protein
MTIVKDVQSCQGRHREALAPYKVIDHFEKLLTTDLFSILIPQKDVDGDMTAYGVAAKCDVT